MHVGIIMDGNGRWATEQGLPRTSGHQAAIDMLPQFIREAREAGVETLTLYAFAKKNWKRDTEEVNFLWQLFDYFIAEHAETFVQENGRFRCIGDRSGIPEKSLAAIEALEQRSKDNTAGTLQVALNYDGEDEIVRAVRKLATEVLAGELQPNEIALETLKTALDTKGESDPDVVIRTGVDENREAPAGYTVWRSSSFLQLQSAQAVCVSTTTRWPDFTIEHLQTALRVAKPNSRLFGGQRV